MTQVDHGRPKPPLSVPVNYYSRRVSSIGNGKVLRPGILLKYVCGSFCYQPKQFPSVPVLVGVIRQLGYLRLAGGCRVLAECATTSVSLEGPGLGFA